MTDHAGGLGRIDHVVTLMLENRSFDHVLGYLYRDSDNRSPRGHAFEGLSGDESNPDDAGTEVPVFDVEPSTPNAWYMPGADPGEGFLNTNSQLFGTTRPKSGQKPDNRGFVKNYAFTLSWQKGAAGWNVLPGTCARDIMGIYTPKMLPVLSALARGYAVCDRWYSSVPTETFPNRAFVHMATSQGYLRDRSCKVFTAPSIYRALEAAGHDWAVYGDDAPPLTRGFVADITSAPNAHFGEYADFARAADDGKLPAYTFLEPSWGQRGNSQHPNYDMAAGEALLARVYATLRGSKCWESTLLVVTYDEHGGCYDHVAPPDGAAAPALHGHSAEYGFGFDRFGVRVPTVLVSPWIEAGTVFRAPDGGTPLDHTSILATLEQRFGVAPLTARDAAAPHVGAALTLDEPRTDDVLAGVEVPSAGAAAHDDSPSYLDRELAEAAARHPAEGDERGEDTRPPELPTHADVVRYARARYAR